MLMIDFNNQQELSHDSAFKKNRFQLYFSDVVLQC